MPPLYPPDFQIGISPCMQEEIRVEQNENIRIRVICSSNKIRTSSPEEVDISPQMDQQREDQSVP